MLFSIVFAVIVLLGSVWAWFTGTDSVWNKLRVRQYDFRVDLVDVFTPPDVPVKPNLPIPKKVSAANTGLLPGFVRVMAFPVITASDGVTPLNAEMGKQVLADLNTKKWKDGGDGYYYYLDILQPGEETEPLFNEVRVLNELGAEYNNAQLMIEVKSEAVGIAKWEYRVGWWGSEAEPSGVLYEIDSILSQRTS